MITEPCREYGFLYKKCRDSGYPGKVPGSVLEVRQHAVEVVTGQGLNDGWFGFTQVIASGGAVCCVGMDRGLEVRSPCLSAINQRVGQG